MRTISSAVFSAHEPRSAIITIVISEEFHEQAIKAANKRTLISKTRSSLIAVLTRQSDYSIAIAALQAKMCSNRINNGFKELCNHSRKHAQTEKQPSAKNTVTSPIRSIKKSTL